MAMIFEKLLILNGTACFLWDVLHYILESKPRASPFPQPPSPLYLASLCCVGRLSTRMYMQHLQGMSTSLKGRIRVLFLPGNQTFSFVTFEIDVCEIYFIIRRVLGE